MFKTFCDYSFNIWTGDDTAYGLKEAISLCEQTGQFGRRAETFAKAKNSLMYMKSQKLMDMQQKITFQNKEMNRVNFEIQRRTLYHESKDIMHEAVIDKRSKLIMELVDHIRGVLDGREILVSRLQFRIKENFLKMEEKFHRQASEFCCMAGALLSDLAASMDDIKWFNTSLISNHQLDSLIGELSAVLASLESYYKRLEVMSQKIYNMHG